MRRMEHREAVVMFTGQDCVLHPGAFGHPRQRARIPPCWIERLGGRVIFVDRNALPVRQRADTSDQRPRQLEPALAAMSPMDEHSESCLVKPRFHQLGILAFIGCACPSRVGSESGSGAVAFVWLVGVSYDQIVPALGWTPFR